MNILYVLFISFITIKRFNNDLKFSNKYRKIKTDGLDHRFNQTSDFDLKLFSHILINIEKKKLLEKLTDNSIGIIDKLKIIEENKIIFESNDFYKNLGKNDFDFDF